MADSDYALDPTAVAYAKTDAYSSAGVMVETYRGWRFKRSAAEATASSTTAVLAAVTDNGSARDITSGITNPTCPRNITVTFGGTAGDIKAITVTVYGTNYNDEQISETFLATVDTANTVTGSKAFKTVTRVTIPAHDGTGATTAVGYGTKLGLPYKLTYNTNFRTFLGTTLEGTAATVVTSTSALESNTITLNSSLNGSSVLALFAGL